MPDIKRKRPEADLQSVVKKTAKEHKPGAGVNKQFTSLKATEGEAGTVNVMPPSDEQLNRINQFTRTPKTAEEVVVFETYSCNDMYDRDDDGFKRNCIQDFSKLETPFSFVGKSFMVGHDYEQLPVGRIFGVSTEKREGVEHLKNEIYLPNTDSNKSFIENVDYGVYWAVSVGVMLGKSACSICDAPMMGGYWTFCMNGHEKSLSYDPSSDEVDAFGWPVPVEPDGKNAVKCYQDLYEPKDAYELSMVFLGAQYMAELSKRPDFAGVIKAASKRKLPVIGLSKSEADGLPLPHEQDQVAEARQKYEVHDNEDGSQTWVDDENLVWAYEPETSEVVCLGKKDNDEEDEEEVEDGEGQQELEQHEPEVPGSDDEDDPEAGGGDRKVAPGTEAGGLDERDRQSPEAVGSQEDNMDKQAVLAAVKAVELPFSFTEKLADAPGSGLEVVLQEAATQITDLQKQVTDLTTKATLGDSYIKSLKADAVDWYTKAHKDPDNRGVNVESFQKILEHCGENVELIKVLIDEQKSLAQARFPESVRRSSFESNPNEVTAPPATPSVDSSDTVSRIHR